MAARYTWGSVFPLATVSSDAQEVTLGFPLGPTPNIDLPTFIATNVLASGLHTWTLRIRFTASGYCCVGVVNADVSPAPARF